MVHSCKFSVPRALRNVKSVTNPHLVRPADVRKGTIVSTIRFFFSCYQEAFASLTSNYSTSVEGPVFCPP